MGIGIGILLGVITIIILAVVIVKRICRKKISDIEQPILNDNQIGNKLINDADPNNQSTQQMVIKRENLPL